MNLGLVKLYAITMLILISPYTTTKLVTRNAKTQDVTRNYATTKDVAQDVHHIIKTARTIVNKTQEKTPSKNVRIIMDDERKKQATLVANAFTKTESSLFKQLKAMIPSSKNRQDRIRPKRLTAEKRQQHKNTVAYFYGHEIIRYSNLDLNFDRFTISFWIYAEGGQQNKAPIVRIYNHCSFVDTSSLSFGIRTIEKEMLVYFTMRTSHSNASTTLIAESLLKIQTWVHVAGSYDGQKMVLYVNQAKVAASFKQKGIFASSMYPKCTTLDVGGDSEKQTTFRGAVDRILIVNEALDHRTIWKKPFISFRKLFILRENFEQGPKTRYHSVHGFLPDLIEMEVKSEPDVQISLEIPKCGHTLCDNPEVILNYVANPQIYMSMKEIRYRIVLITQDDGRKCRLTTNDIHKKHKDLVAVFNREDIHLHLDIVKFKNSNLCNKTVLISCYRPCPDDTVDCQQSVPVDPVICQQKCTPDKLNNGQCDIECNNPDGGNNWDRGDCCDPKVTDVTSTCYDPASPYRAFIEEGELKKHFNLSNEEALVIFPVLLPINFLGKSTYPWTENIYGVNGGITMNYKSFLTTTTTTKTTTTTIKTATTTSSSSSSNEDENVNDIIHEVGHALGLWHVHRGISEVSCSNECVEDAPSMITGDLCSDTKPTPTNYKCKDQVVHHRECNGKKESVVFQNTPYKNYMGYVTGSCASEFTTQQKARMHCYLDRNYQRWQIDSVAPSTVPLKPSLVSYSKKSVKIAWHPPIGSGKLYQRFECQECQDEINKEQHQYVEKVAFNNKTSLSKSLYSLHKIIGPPDAKTTCTRDSNTWIRQHPGKNDYLDLWFRKAVIPVGLKIWITYDATDAIADLQLIHIDGSTTVLGPVSTSCKTPYTTRIKTSKLTKHLRIHFSSNAYQKTSIDAVMLISENTYDKKKCRNCEKLQVRYRVYRQPPFKADKPYRCSKTTSFIDKGVEPNTMYTYRIQALSGSLKSQLSSPLIFQESNGFCGNGIIEKHRGEECDDANLRDGDGCDVECRIEAVFNCKLEPSLCYRYDRDGICEEKERKFETRDCGLYTPNGYIDQWASEIKGKPLQSSEEFCPENTIAGTPPTNLKCVDGISEIDPKIGWRPCNGFNPETFEIFEDYWIEASFRTSVHPVAVIVHLSSDGRFDPISPNETLSIRLRDDRGRYDVINDMVDISCKANPIYVKVQNNTIPSKTVRIDFATSNLAISGIALRSMKPESCSKNQFYDEKKKTCTSKTAEVLPCPKLILLNANVTCSNEGSLQSCKIRCHVGFERTNQKTVFCDHGTWRNAIGCSVIDCGQPNIENSNTVCNGTTFGSECSLSCGENTSQQGSDRILTCRSNGHWSKQRLHCVQMCTANPFEMKMESYKNQLPGCLSTDGPSYEMGTRCRLQCRQGYTAARKLKSRLKPTIINALCNQDGKWSYDNDCEKIECPLTDYQKILYSCTNVNRYGSVCKTSCSKTKAGYQVECLHTGQWSDTLDVCQSEKNCPEIQDSNGVKFSSCSNTKVGSRCQPTCNSRKDLVLKNQTSHSAIQNNNNNGDQHLYCMPNLKWTQSTGDYRCEEKCYTRGIGDTFCDCQNNRPHCQFDGGDCCRKSVIFLTPEFGTCSCIQL